MTSEYPVLNDRPIDKWKVTELKEELKRRMLTTRGLKDELVRRLDEALRAEIEDTGEEMDNSVNDPESEVVHEVAKTEGTVIGELDMGITVNAEESLVREIGIDIPINAEKTVGDSDVNSPINAEKTAIGDSGNNSEVEIASVQVDVKDHDKQPHQEEILLLEQKETELVNDQPTGMEMSFATYAPSTDMSDQVSENLSLGTAMGVQKLENDNPEIDNEDFRAQQDSNYTDPLHEDVKLDLAVSNNQVSKVSSNLGFPLKSNSNSTISISVCEKKEVEDNVIADGVKLETDFKPEMVQPSSSDLVPVGGKSHPKFVEEPLENELCVEGRENHVTNADISQNNLSAGLDRSSGDDSMEEDELESKQINSKYNTGEVGLVAEKSEVANLEEEAPFTAIDADFPAEDKFIPSEDKGVVAAIADKRKFPDQEADLDGEAGEPAKRQRRWKSEGSNVRDPPQIPNITSPVAPKDVQKSVALTHNFSRSDSDIAINTLKEREVPPSTNAITNALRIDNFLRPLTLKAVQDLLSKTGTVACFWMDHIKTHCYVTYSTVEEAVATRNAVYNLQWPPNGGRCLVAEFVDPEEAKVRVDPVTVSVPPSTAVEPPQPSPWQQTLRQQLLSRQTTHSLKEEKVKEEAPILTLDDLFRKTKTTPRIYYLPLSEEQVSSKLEARQKSSGLAVAPTVVA